MDWVKEQGSRLSRLNKKRQEKKQIKHTLNTTKNNSNVAKSTTNDDNDSARGHSSSRDAAAMTGQEAAMKRLKQRLSRPRKMGIPTTSECFFDSQLNKIITEETIRKALPGASENIINFASKNIKIFAILLQLSIDNKQLVITLGTFESEGFNDGSLPNEDIGKSCHANDIPDYEPDGSCNNVEQKCEHDSRLNVFHDPFWDSPMRTLFRKSQWQFCMPHLSLSDNPQAQIFSSQVILPIVRADGSSMKGSGHFSEVYKGEILAEYQNEIEKKGERIPIAIKQLKDRPTDKNIVEDEWLRETDALHKFNKLHHKNITRAVASCKHGDIHYIFLEWADGDNLRKFWDRNPNPTLSEKNVFELLYQVYGLVDALYHMHGDSDLHDVVSRSQSFVSRKGRSGFGASFEAGRQSSKALARASTTGSQAVEESGDASGSLGFGGNAIQHTFTQDEPSIAPDIVVHDPIEEQSVSGQLNKNSNWRHGDIKPENILVFNDDTSFVGTLKLGDFGRAKKHQFATVNPQRRRTGEKYATIEYEPPEAVLDVESARSRKYDIWAMGCIIYESVCWLLYGIAEKRRIEVKSVEVAVKGTKYWVEDPNCPEIPKAKVNPRTARVIDRILKIDPACNDRAGTVLRDLLLLVKEHLLVVHLPEKDPRGPLSPRPKLPVRCDTQKLHETMKEIVRKAENHSSYLCKTVDRTDVKSLVNDLLADDDQRDANPAQPEAGPSQQAGSALGYLGAPAEVGRRDSYAHEERDIWEFQDDTRFCNLVFLDDITISEYSLPQIPSKLCQSCSDLDFPAFPQKFERRLQDLEISSKQKGCTLCSLLARAALGVGVKDNDVAIFNSSESSIKLQGGPKPILSLCQSSPRSMPRIRTGFPSISAPASQAQFAIMRKWLATCDDGHNGHEKCKRSPPVIDQYPNRVIDLGLDGSRIHIIETKNVMDRLNKDELRYVAFSHPWGSAAQNSHFKSTKQNIASHSKEGISVGDLPNTFQAAIKITRELTIKYLWIDSLCILQGSNGDFEQESKRMEYIFSSAYVTIAASSATGTSSRILGSRPASVAAGADAGTDENGNIVRGDREIACLMTKGDNPRPYFIAESMDDFQADVLDGPLNQRGWVFQERALSRRTIHLTKTQAYWECGDGIRCETLTKLSNPQVGFLGDPNFPDVASRLSKGGRIYYYESLYEKYSTLKLTKDPDRSVALYGVESRLCQTLGDQGGYGVFKNNLGRGLLWRRKNDTPLIRIDFSADPSRSRVAPSWSWMAWTGAIQYISPIGGSLDWNREVNWIVENGELTQTLEAYVWTHKIGDRPADSKARLDMDDGTQFPSLDCRLVVIGSQKVGKKRYVVVVREAPNAIGDAIYHRVGVGWVVEELLGEKIAKPAQIQ